MQENLLQALLSCIGPGLFLILSMGPVAFTVINTSLNKGFKIALFLIAGITLSDMFYIFLSNFGASTLITNKIQWVYYLGGVILIAYGLFLWLQKPKMDESHLQIKKNTHWMYLAKGFIINCTAPGVILFWTANAGVLANEGFTTAEKIVYFSGILLMVNASDVAKAYFAKKLKKWLSPMIIHRIQQVLGIGMIIFGVVLIYKGFK